MVTFCSIPALITEPAVQETTGRHIKDAQKPSLKQFKLKFLGGKSCRAAAAGRPSSGGDGAGVGSRELRLAGPSLLLSHGITLKQWRQNMGLQRGKVLTGDFSSGFLNILFGGRGSEGLIIFVTIMDTRYTRNGTNHFSALL